MAQDFEDEPLETVTQDNIDVDIYIGPSSAFDKDGSSLMPNEEARSYSTTELEVEVSNNDEHNWAIGKLWGDGHNVKPDEGHALKRDDPPEIITIDVDNELMEARTDIEEVTRIWTGVIANSSSTGDGAFEIMSFWPGYNALRHDSVEVDVPLAEHLKKVQFGGVDVQTYDFSTQRRQASDIAEQIGELVTDGSPFEHSVNIGDDGVEVGTRPDGETTIAGIDTQVPVQSSKPNPIVDDSGSDGLLQTIVEKTNSIWDIDRYGNFYIGAPQPTSHKIRYITETDAGRRSPAWRSVRVIGDGVVSQDGWSASAMMNEDPDVLDGNVTQTVEDGDIEDAERLAEPVFTYRNRSIATREEAEHVLDKLREEIREQMAGGEITVVGHPEVWPGDAVEMPDAPGQPFDRDRYLIKKVVHRLNNSDGFLTKIEVGGMTLAAETTFSDEKDFRNKEYEGLAMSDRKLYEAAEEQGE